MLRPPSKYGLTAHLSLLAVGTFVLGVDAFVLAGLLPAVARDLDVSVAQAGQLTTAFTIAYAVSSPVIATATGALDRRAVLFGGMVVFLLGMVAQALGPTFAVALAGRVLSGAGAAAFQANAFAVAGVLSPPERRARSLAVVGAGASLAGVAGVPFGVLIGQSVGWRGAMWTIAGLAAVAAALTVTLPSVRLPLVSLRERLRVLATPEILTLLCGTALLVIPMYAVTNYVAPLVSAEGQTSSTVLVTLVVFGVAFFAGNRLVGLVTDRFGALRTLVAGSAVEIVALAGLWAAHPRLVPTVIALALLGLAAPSQITTQQARVFAAGGAAATVALGLNGSMIYVGGGAASALGGGLLATAGIASIAPAAAAVAVLTLVFTVTTAPERRRLRPRDPADGPAPTAENREHGAVTPT